MILGIDTATSSLSVAFADETRVLSSALINRPQSHDELLVPVIEEVLRNANGTFADLEAIAVSAGPGSFTGLRIGLAVAKGLCFGTGKPLVLVPTFDAIAYQSARMIPEEAVLAILFDARRGEVYCGVYRIRLGEMEVLDAVFVTDVHEAAKRIPTGALLIGDGAQKLFASPSNFRIMSTETMHTAESIAFLGYRLLREGHVADPATAEPLYLRGFQTTTPRRKATTSAKSKE